MSNSNTNLWGGSFTPFQTLYDKIQSNNQFLQDQNAANVVGGVDPTTVGGAEGFPTLDSNYTFDPNISSLYTGGEGGSEGVDSGYGGSVKGDENNLFARAMNRFGETFGTGEGFLSNLGKGGEGFGRKFGTGEGTMRGFGRIGSYREDERGFIDDPNNPGTKIPNPAFGSVLDEGKGFFGKKGGFMSKFGTGKGTMAGLLGGMAGGIASGMGGGEGGASAPEEYQYGDFFGSGNNQPWYTE